MCFIQHFNFLALVFIIFVFGFRHSFCISCFSFLYWSSSFMFLHFLLSPILRNISEFIQFCFFGNCSFPQISSATVAIPSLNLFQISPIFIPASIFSSCSYLSSRVLKVFLISGFLKLFMFHLTVFLDFLTL